METLTTVLPENLERILIIIPMTVAITQGIKQVLPKTIQKFTWILSMAIGIGFAYLYVGAESLVFNNYLIILWGILAGLSASGLYSAINSSVKVFK